MPMRYNPLWKLLIDKKMTKKYLREQTGISQSTLDRMVREENVSLDVVGKICDFLDCQVSDVVEFYKE